jgi:hypothetical protein
MAVDAELITAFGVLAGGLAALAQAMKTVARRRRPRRVRRCRGLRQVQSRIRSRTGSSRAASALSEEDQRLIDVRGGDVHCGGSLVRSSSDDGMLIVRFREGRKI